MNDHMNDHMMGGVHLLFVQIICLKLTTAISIEHLLQNIFSQTLTAYFTFNNSNNNIININLVSDILTDMMKTIYMLAVYHTW